MDTANEAREPNDGVRRPDTATALDTLSRRVAAFRALVTGTDEAEGGRTILSSPSRAWTASARARRY